MYGDLQSRSAVGILRVCPKIERQVTSQSGRTLGFYVGLPYPTQPSMLGLPFYNQHKWHPQVAYQLDNNIDALLCFIPLCLIGLATAISVCQSYEGRYLSSPTRVRCVLLGMSRGLVVHQLAIPPLGACTALECPVALLN